MIAVLDTGGVSALAPVDEKTRARLRALRQQVDDIMLPAVVLAEGLLTGHGRDHHVRRLLSQLNVLDIDEVLGLSAGRLRTQAIAGGAKPAPSGVDAIVAAVADAVRDDVQLVTSDPDDMAALLTYADHPGRVAILQA